MNRAGLWTRTLLSAGSIVAAAAVALLLAAAVSSGARGETRLAQAGGTQHPMGHGPMQPAAAATPAPAPPAAPHGGHGQAPDWKPTWPAGNPTRGREAFERLECYSCHEVKGENFPAPDQPGRVGPELSQMGPLHTIEYFAEAILNPSASMETGKGYEGPDGSSRMPSYNDVLTVQQLIDLVAYLRTLRPPAAGVTAPAAHGGATH